MKKLFFLASVLFLGTVFLSATKINNTPIQNSLEGVWEMEHQFIYENDEVLDTLYNLNGYRQVKIYSKGKVMWTRFNPNDQNEWYGYGSYEIKDGYLQEQLEYASNEMMKIVDTVQVFRFQLVFGNGTYSQITLDADGNKYNSENYKRIE